MFVKNTCARCRKTNKHGQKLKERICQAAEEDDQNETSAARVEGPQMATGGVVLLVVVELTELGEKTTPKC